MADKRLTNAQIRTLLLPATPATATSVTSITAASPAVLTATAHGLLANTYGLLAAPSVDAGLGPKVYKISAVTANTFTLKNTDATNADNSGGTGGAQTCKFHPVTAGLLALLRTAELAEIEDALHRIPNVRSLDELGTTGESTLDVVFPAGGVNP